MNEEKSRLRAIRQQLLTIVDDIERYLKIPPTAPKSQLDQNAIETYERWYSYQKVEGERVLAEEDENAWTFLQDRQGQPIPPLEPLHKALLETSPLTLGEWEYRLGGTQKNLVNRRHPRKR